MRTSRRTSRGLRRNAKKPKMSEMSVWNAIGTVRSIGPSNQASRILPPGVVSHFKRLPPGLYKYGFSPKKGEGVFLKFSTPSVRGAMTSTRIGASATHEYHWLVDNFDPNFPVVVRGIDDRGHSFFRVEEYAKLLDAEHEYAVIKKHGTAKN